MEKEQLVVYTDGSKIGSEVGSAVVAPKHGWKNAAYMGNNTVSNVYAAELLGVHMALAMAVRHGGGQSFKKVWVFTDNQAAILSTYRPRAQSGQYILRRIWDQYTQLTEQGVEVEIR